MTSWASASASASGLDPSPCRHHWIIQPALGPHSLGVCLGCGESREFNNSVGNHTWDDYNLGFRAGLNRFTMAIQGGNDHGTFWEEEDG